MTSDQVTQGLDNSVDNPKRGSTDLADREIECLGALSRAHSF